jgi:branched-subunit amino acid transport protein
MQHNVWIYLLIMAAVTYLIRVLPLTLIRREITNRFLRSFLYYVPYVTLSVMTFPAILSATNSAISAAAALVVAILVAWFNGSLFKVAIAACATVFVLELALPLF